MNRAAVFAAALALQVAAAHAQGDMARGQASFMFDGDRVEVSMDGADAARFAPRFATVAPSCDPQCIGPAQAGVGIDTVVEPEVLEFLVDAVGQGRGLLVDARLPQDRAMGFLPGSVSLPHTTLAQDAEYRDEILKALGARGFEDVFNFADAQTLVIYDNGPTQNDAGVLIAHLLEAGYPPEKIRYYRGGMQVWSIIGLTVQE